MKREIVELGTFDVVSGVLRISDPCYDKKTWCAGSVDNVLNGVWKAQVLKKTEDDWGHRCRKLIAVHESFDKSTCTFEKLNIDVGVDSGQAGIFDDKFFKKNYKEDYLRVGEVEYNHKNYHWGRKHDLPMYEAMLAMAKDEYSKALYQDKIDSIKSGIIPPPDYSKAEKTRDWYEICCDKTLSDVGAGVIRNGVVSSSGYGDGSYRAYAAYNQKGQVVGIKILF